MYFSNSIFTMMGAPEKKILSDVFFAHINLLVCKISSLSDMPNRFFANKYHIFTNIWWEYFFLNLLRVFDQTEVEFSKSGENWANTRSLLLKTFEGSNCVDRHIVHWSSPWPHKGWRSDGRTGGLSVREQKL